MYFRHEQDLLLTSGPAQPVRRVPWDSEFSFVSSLRWCPQHEELLVTAVQHGRRTPDVRGGDRGDLALYRCMPDDRRWHTVYDGYSHDCVCLPGTGYAVHRGGGITFLDRDGTILRENKVGRFNWGPPSLSVSPDGSRMAWIRWRGDDRKLCLEDIVSADSRQLTTAVYNYAWLDSSTLLYRLGSGLRLLDATTGRTSRFGPRLQERILGASGVTPELAGLATLAADDVWELDFCHQVVDGTVWYAAGLADKRSVGLSRATGLFRTDATGSRTELVMMPAENELIQSFHAFSDGSAVVRIAVYENLTIVDRRRTAVGPLAGFLEEGWQPVMTSQTPEMGFHAMP